ncbi:MAG TPA: hypothetical protein VHJ78_05165 [Actinomycetota bacterium]|nr:hypothetical protein [Actinomycetota bacterium]
MNNSGTKPENSSIRMRTKVSSSRRAVRTAVVGVSVVATVVGSFGAEAAFATGSACPIWQCGFNHSEVGALPLGA